MRRNVASSALLQLTWNTFEKFLTSLGTLTDDLDKLFLRLLTKYFYLGSSVCPEASLSVT